MFNLNKVYGIISLEKTNVTLVVFDVASSQKHCLFYKSVELKNSSNFSNLINETEISEVVNDLCYKADEFTGMNIKRYIINIPSLSLNKISCKSPGFKLITPYVDDDSRQNYDNMIDMLSSNKDDKVVNARITKWYIDNRSYTTYPVGEKGNYISFEYLQYTCDKIVYDTINRIINDANICCLKITTNEIVNDFSDATSLFISNENSTILNNNLKLELPIGYDWIENEIRSKLNLDKKISIKNIINLCNNISVDAPIIDMYNKKYLDCIQITSNLFKKVVIFAVKKYLNKINEILIENNISQLNIFADNSSFKLFSIAKKYIPEFDTIFILSKSNILFCENKNIKIYENVVDYVSSFDTSKNAKSIYSVDTYYDDKLLNEQFKNNIIIKIGTFSTAWAAKLGNN